MPRNNGNSSKKTSRRASTRPRGANTRGRRLRIRSELRRNPDLQGIADSVIALTLAQAEKDAQAQALDRVQDQSAESVGADPDVPRDGRS